jgi:hypothetical protein
MAKTQLHYTIIYISYRRTLSSWLKIKNAYVNWIQLSEFGVNISITVNVRKVATVHPLHTTTVALSQECVRFSTLTFDLQQKLRFRRHLAHFQL